MSEELNLSQRIKEVLTQKDWDKLNRSVVRLFKDGSTEMNFNL